MGKRLMELVKRVWKPSLILVVFGIAWLFCQESNLLKPCFVVKQKSINLGQVPYKSQISFQLVFKNQGVFPLKLSSVETSCDCLVAEWLEKSIYYNCYDTIFLSFRADSKGSFYRELRVSSNASNPIFHIGFHGVIQ